MRFVQTKVGTPCLEQLYEKCKLCNTEIPTSQDCPTTDDPHDTDASHIHNGSSPLHTGPFRW